MANTKGKATGSISSEETGRVHTTKDHTGKVFSHFQPIKAHYNLCTPLFF